MRPLRLLLFYFASVFLGAALIAPWIFHLAEWAASGRPALRQLADYPFHRFVNRSLLFLALLGLWPFLRSLGIRNWKDLGFTPLRSSWKNGAAGFFLGFCSLAVLAVLSVSFGARTIDLHHSMKEVLGELLGATASAIAVALLEECLFRGALFGALRKSNSWQVALVLSSAIFALLHFFGKPDSPETIHWTSGFTTLASMFKGFGELDNLVPTFFNLFIVGAILAFAYQRTGNLYFSIGLHAGWIFWLRSCGMLTNKTPHINPWIWGSGKLIDGWLATAVLGFVFALVLVRYQPAKRAVHVA